MPTLTAPLRVPANDPPLVASAQPGATGPLSSDCPLGPSLRPKSGSTFGLSQHHTLGVPETDQMPLEVRCPAGEVGDPVVGDRLPRGPDHDLIRLRPDPDLQWFDSHPRDHDGQRQTIVAKPIGTKGLTEDLDGEIADGERVEVLERRGMAAEVWVVVAKERR